MRRVAGSSPLVLRSSRSIHPTTFVAALTVAAVFIAGALYIGEKAAAYLPDKITITSWKPPTLAREAKLATEQSQISNREKKTAREKGRAIEARLTPPSPAPKPDATIVEDGASPELGRASWYDLDTPTANGEALDDSEPTAAHRSLPFGTKLRVVNLKNGREVVVRVNDRGPFAKDRIIDLSKAAARELDMIADGVAEVSVLRLDDDQLAGNSDADGEPETVER